MGTAFAQFFSLLTLIFATVQEAFSALFNLAAWANEASGQFTDISRHERQVALEKMKKEAGINELPKRKEVPVAATQRKLSRPEATQE